MEDNKLDQTYRRIAEGNITEQVPTEAALRPAYAEMERHVQEQTAELAAANRALQAELAERRRVEEALRASEERFRIVLKDSLTTVFCQDRDLRYTWIYNPAVPLPEAAIQGKSDTELLPSDDAQRLTAVTRRVLTTGVGCRAEVNLTIDGRTRWFDLKVEPLRDAEGTIVGIAGAATDVTDYHHAREAQRILAEVSAQLTPALDPATRLHNLARLLISNLADLCIINIVDDSTCPSTVIAHRDSATEAQIMAALREYSFDLGGQSPMAQVLQSGQVLYIRVLSDELVRSWFSAGPTPLAPLAHSGLTSYIGVPLIARARTIGVLSLITDRSGRCYEPADVELAHELAQRAATAIDNVRLYAAEQRVRAEAESALRMRDQVFHLVSHDLKSPLTTIQGYVHLLQRHIQEAHIPHSERILRGITNIGAATQRMAAQIQELLDVAAVQMGQSLTLRFDRLDLVALVARLTDAYRQMSSQHTISVRTPHTPVLLMGDELRLERVLDNLLTNAVKYSPDGGKVQVTLTREEQDERPWAILTVSDQGIGIPAADLPHIFDPFRRARNIADKTQGTGLGLASVRQIIEQHGGTITVASEEGAGTTFTIRLPLNYS